MRAVVLAGGKGTRLRPFTATIPKPLLPLGDTPIIEVVIRQLAAAGFERITLCLNHMAPFFDFILGNGSKWEVSIDYVIEDAPLGTAGSLRLIDDLPEHFLVMNADVLTTLPFADLMAAHVAAGTSATIAVASRTVPIDFGVLEFDSDSRLSSYSEKPSLQYYVSMGVYVFSRSALQHVPNERHFDVPDLMTRIYKSGAGVLCYLADCYWQDIGRLDDYERATSDFLRDSTRFLDAD